MKKIKIKPISDEYFLLHQDNKKIGQMIKNKKGYTVKINGQELKTYPSWSNLKESKLFEFSELKKELKKDSCIKNQVHGFETKTCPYNSVWNLKYKLPLYTASDNSKCWFAAGYYKIIIEDKETVEFCPKLVTLLRNKYKGPFKKRPLTISEKLIDWG